MKHSLILSILFIPFMSFSQLTGYWQTDKGGCYQIIQDGYEIWWAGESPGTPRAKNIFYGTISGNDVTGRWCDMPSNSRRGCGESLSLRLENNNRMVKVTSSAPYNGSVWTKQSGVCGSDLILDLIPCTPKICGGFAANSGDYHFNSGSGQIIIDSKGNVRLNLPSLFNKNNQRVGAITFDVNYGTFGPSTWNGGRTGSFKTKPDGSYYGSITVSVDRKNLKSIVLNAGGKSQFITR